MSFKKTGAPVDLEIIDFNSDKAVDVTCHKCGSVIGRKAAGLFKPLSSSRSFPISGKIETPCPICRETTYGL